MKFLKAILPSYRNEKKIQKRKAQLEALPPHQASSQQAFAEALKQDPALEVRLLACHLLTDLSLLQQYVGSEQPEALAEAAARRIQQLLLGKVAGGPDCAQRLQWIEAAGDDSMLEQIASKGEEPELRIAAIERISRQGLLGDIAINDKNPEVRWSAVQRIEKPATLERVAKEVKNRDKRVCTWAKEQLAKIEAKNAKPDELAETAKKICDELALIGHQCRQENDWLSSIEPFNVLEQRWQECKEQWQALKCGRWDDELQERYQRITTTFRDKADKQRQQQQLEQQLEAELAPYISAMKAVCDPLAQQVVALKSAQPDQALVEQLSTLLAQSESQWQQLDRSKVPLEHSLHGEYERLHQSLVSHHKAMRDYLKGHTSLGALLAEQAKLESGERQLTPKALAWQEKQLASLPQSAGYPLDAALCNQAKQQLQSLHERFEAQQNQRQNNLDKFTRLVPEIEEAHKQGASKEAIQHLRQAQKCLAELSDFDQNGLRKKGLLRRFQAVRKQVEELQDWKRWSSAPVKERLVDEMEQLAQQLEENSENALYDFPEAAHRIRSTRNEWKTVNVRERGESPELWERFDEACNRGYAICQRYFDQEHQYQEQALAQRQSTCETLEVYAQRIPEQIEGGTIDWKGLDQVIRTAESEWRNLPQPHVKVRKKINKRFHDVMAILRQFVDDERLRNKEEKQQLISRAEALVNELKEGELEIPEAIDKVKLLQAKWKEIGPAKSEKSLWKAFRQQCDEVFNQRAAASQAFKDELNSHLEARQMLIDKVLELAKLEGEALRHARAELENIKQQWQAAGPIPNRKKESVERAFRKACEQFEQQDHQRLVLVQQEKWDALEKRAELCEQLEHGLAQGAVDLDAIQTQWQALEATRCIAQEEITQRFNDAIAISQEGDVAALMQQRLQQGLDTRLRLCLELEILAEIDSPAQYAQERMAYQVSILAEKMAQENQAKGEEALTLKCQWLTCHAAPGDQAEALNSRYQQAMLALQASVEKALAIAA